MSLDPHPGGNAVYCNPVFASSFPDPFLIKFCGEYYGYCTGQWSDGRIFGVLHSTDLVNWKPLGGAMKPLTEPTPFYWAPEVTYDNGKFYLYYSSGNETLMELRVAISDRPDGGFVDSGTRLTSQEFAIDAHVFVDDDGQKWLFYATDFLEHSHIGTGTVVDKLDDWFTLAQDPHVVTRAKYDWQVYDPNRAEKGGVRWHTVEGPFVLKRKGIYYEMFSGGNWKDPSYGVSFALSDAIVTKDEWPQFSDGKNVFPILRTVPEKVSGPGHNSVIRGPNNRELYCVYHSWSANERVLDIDRMDFAGSRIFINGASSTPQPAPFQPQITLAKSDDWEQQGGWVRSGNRLRNSSFEKSSLICNPRSAQFLVELDIAVDKSVAGGTVGISLSGGPGEVFAFLLKLESRLGILRYEDGESTFYLPADLDLASPQLLRLEVDGRGVKVNFGGHLVRSEGRIASEAARLNITSDNAIAEIRSFALTRGYEDLFEGAGDARDRGWKVNGSGTIKVTNGEMTIESLEAGTTFAIKGESFESFDFAANIRAIDVAEGSRFGIIFSHSDNSKREFSIRNGALLDSLTDAAFQMPQSYNQSNFRQFRFTRKSETLRIESEDVLLGEIRDTRVDGVIGIFAERCTVSADMVRCIEI